MQRTHFVNCYFIRLFLYCVMLPFSGVVAIITVHAVIKGTEKLLYWAETQTSSFFGWKIILVQRARRCYGVQHDWAPWLLHDTKTWTFTSGIFSSFPVGAKFIRSLSHRDEAVCPHRNHIMWHRTKTQPSPLNGNLKKHCFAPLGLTDC